MFLTWLICAAILCGFASLAPNKIANEPPCKKAKVEPVGKCVLRFSKFVLGSEDTLNDLFIEIKASCSQKRGPAPKYGLAAYKLLVIRTSPISIHAVVDFSLFPFNDKEKFIVIGSPPVQNVDISFSSGHVQTTFSTIEPNKMLPKPGEGQYAFILVEGVPKAEARHLSIKITREEKTLPKVLTSDQIKLIREKTVDFIVLTNDDPTQEFAYFWQQIPPKPMFLTDLFKLSTSVLNLSICDPMYNGFDTGAFKATIKSPGQPNVCEDKSDLDVTIEVGEDEAAHALMHHVDDTYISRIREHAFDVLWIEKCEDKFPEREKILESTVQDWIQFDTNCKFRCFACHSYYEAGFRPDIKKRPSITTTGFLSNDKYYNNEAVKVHQKNSIHKEHSNIIRLYKDLLQTKKSPKLLLMLNCLKG